MNSKMKKLLCLLLSAVLIIGLTSGSVPGTMLTAFASESGEAVIDPQEEESVTEGDTQSPAETVEEEIEESDAPQTESESEEETDLTEAAEIYVAPESTPVTEIAKAATKDVAYLEGHWDATEKKVVYETVSGTASVLTADLTDWVDSIYVAEGELTISGRVKIDNPVKLILADGATLTLEKGITLNKTLTVYAQSQESENTGILIAKGTDQASGIGDSASAGCSLTIHGGNVIATGGDSAAGIGLTVGVEDGIADSVIVYGGTVKATGSNGAAGIGGKVNGVGGSVTVYGGTVIASGAAVVVDDQPVDDEFGKGIGAGFSDTASLDNGTLTVAEGVKVYGGSSPDPTEEITDYATNRPQYMIIKKVHVHNFSYAADGATITATCNAEGCDLPDHKVSVTLSASDATYSGSPYTGASLDSTAWEEAGLDAPAIEYEGRGETSYTKSETAPTKAGTYTASITVDSATATADFTISARQISRTVTFQVVNGYWNDGTNSDKVVTLTGYAGDTLTLSSGQIPSVGSNPNTNYKAGSWDVVPSTSTAITENTTYTYTYAKKEKVSWTVTFKVVNGSWNDKTTEKKTVTLTGYEGDTLKLTSDDIPAVGSNPATNYKAGSWDEEPSTKTAITKNTTYTYTYAKKTSSSSSGSSSSSTSAKTGDNNMIGLWAVLIIAAVAGLAFVIVKRRGKDE